MSVKFQKSFNKRILTDSSIDARSWRITYRYLKELDLCLCKKEITISSGEFYELLNIRRSRNIDAYEKRVLVFKKIGQGVSVNKALSELNSELRSQLSIIIPKKKYLRSRISSRSFPLNKGDFLNIQNSFGDIIIHTWDKNEAKIDIELKGYSNSEVIAEQALSTVTISGSKLGNQLTISSLHDFSKDIYTKVNFDVYMPAENALTIKHAHGNIVIPDFSGPVTINSSFLNLSAGNLSNGFNLFKVSSGYVNIKNLKAGKIDLQNAFLDIGNVERLDLNSDYTNVKINQLTGEGNFAFQRQRVSLGYQRHVKNQDTSVVDTSIWIGLPRSANFKFNIEGKGSKYSFNKKIVKNLEKTNMIEQDTTYMFTGSLGNNSSISQLIKIKAKFCDIDL